MSSLSLEKNGRISSSKRTKHIKAKYFLVKNYYDSGEIDLRYCPTDVMWADVLTKPLQGHKFRDMWAFLQNVQETMMTTLSFNLTSWLRDRWTNKPRLLLHRGSVLKNWQTFQEKNQGEEDEVPHVSRNHMGDIFKGLGLSNRLTRCMPLLLYRMLKMHKMHTVTHYLPLCKILPHWKSK